MPSLFLFDMEMRKIVIANKGAANVGKSTSVMALYKLMNDKGYKELYTKSLNAGEDVSAIFEINDVLVGLESEGDPGESMTNCIEHLIAQKCQIIVTACRTRKLSFEVVNTRLRGAGYDIVWVNHDKCDDKSNTVFMEGLNALYARHILDLILNVIDGKI